MMNFLLFNKQGKKTKCYKRAKGPPFFIKNTWFTKFKLQDAYENLNLTNRTCVLPKKFLASRFSVLDW